MDDTFLCYYLRKSKIIVGPSRQPEGLTWSPALSLFYWVDDSRYSPSRRETQGRTIVSLCLPQLAVTRII